MTAVLSLGIAAAGGSELAARIAPAAEAAGLHALWVNDTPGHDAPALGADTDAVLREVGLSEAQIVALRERGVVG